MKTRRFLCKADLDPFVLDLLNNGIRVIAPLRRKNRGRECIEYARVQNPDEILLEGLLPVRSLKEAVFPPTEMLFQWKQSKSMISLEEHPDAFEETVVIGASPCDAAALDIVDRVMGWEFCDEFWFGHRSATTILALACNHRDEACFCTAMGLSPESSRGADWFLTPAESGFNIEILSPKGQQLLSRQGRRLSELPADDGLRAGPVNGHGFPEIRTKRIQRWLSGHFEDPVWKEIAWRCIGCGACTHMCPTCHCFDIADEPEGAAQGTRRRNWDACQFARFTLQASGHNPRRDQTARFRQRIMHKFYIYPQRFGEVLCTGCGRCVRVCAAGIDLISILQDLDRKAEECERAS